MRCFVYKSLKKADTYVYLARRDDAAALPAALRATLGELDFVLEIELTAERKLAREDAGVVRSNLASRGFHIQLPSDADALAPPTDAAWQRHVRD